MFRYSFLGVDIFGLLFAVEDVELTLARFSFTLPSILCRGIAIAFYFYSTLSAHNLDVSDIICI